MKDNARRPPWDRSTPPVEDAKRPKPNFRTLSEFCAEFRPISYAVDGLICSGSLYTLTARTGTGKTAWLVTTALSVAAGRNDLLGHPVIQGRVAFCTAENPTDLRMRLAVNSYVFNIDQSDVGRDLIVSDNRVRPEEIFDFLRWEAENGPFALIVIDTWQAYFDGSDPNNNAEAVDFTRRFRPLTQLPGNPAVVIAAHPIKNAKNDELVPYGGGSTLNEIDGNLCGWREPGGYFALGWQGKLRGADFEPIHYRIEMLTSPDIKNAKGVEVPMPVMRQVAAEDVEKGQAALDRLDAKLLRAIAFGPGDSIRTWAEHLGHKQGAVERSLARLQRAKLIEKKLGKPRLTPAGRKLLKEEPTAPDEAPAPVNVVPFRRDGGEDGE
jgi:hypothetical protein